MNTTLLVVTGGRRQHLRRTLETLSLSVAPQVFSRRVIANDCQDHDFCDWVERSLGFDQHVRLEEPQGLDGTISAGWEEIQGTDYVFQVPEGFLFQRYIHVKAVTDLLREHPRLAQLALRPQARTDQERAAGGIVELQPTSYVDRHDDRGHQWLEHRCGFTSSPAFFPAWVVGRPWPNVEHAEAAFSLELFQDPQAVCGYWGKREDPPWVYELGGRRTLARRRLQATPPTESLRTA